MDTLFDFESPELKQEDLYKKFITRFNEIRKEYLPKSRGIQPTNQNGRKRLREFLKVYSFKDIEGVITNVFEDDWHTKINWHPVTPDYILREKIIQRYIDAENKQKNDSGSYEYKY